MVDLDAAPGTTESWYLQHFKVYLNLISFSYSIKFPTVPQHKMQHAEKGKQKVQIFFPFPRSNLKSLREKVALTN